MSRTQFGPGRKGRGNIKNLIKNILLCKGCALYNECQCIQEKVALIKTGYNSPLQTQANQVSQIITGTLGGKTTFGNFNRPVTVNNLGSWEGQPGGSFKPPRNKF